jgi:hypothetical protein
MIWTNTQETYGVAKMLAMVVLSRRCNFYFYFFHFFGLTFHKSKQQRSNNSIDGCWSLSCSGFQKNVSGKATKISLNLCYCWCKIGLMISLFSL